MAQVLDLSKSVYEICTKYPVIKGLMAENGFAEITEPGRLQTMGRFMTIPKGCDHKGVDLEELKAIFRAHGFTILGDEESAAAETPADEKPAEAETKDAPIAQTPEERKALIAQYLERLNDGEDIEAVREDFTRNFKDVSGSEISNAEQELIAGGVPMEKVL